MYGRAPSEEKHWGPIPYPHESWHQRKFSDFSFSWRVLCVTLKILFNPSIQEASPVGLRHGSQADVSHQGCGQTQRTTDLIRTCAARRRHRLAKPGAGFVDLSAALQAAVAIARAAIFASR